MNTRARPQDGEEAREKETDALEAQRQRLTDELDTQTKDLTGSKYVDRYIDVLCKCGFVCDSADTKQETHTFVCLDTA